MRALILLKLVKVDDLIITILVRYFIAMTGTYVAYHHKVINTIQSAFDISALLITICLMPLN